MPDVIEYVAADGTVISLSELPGVRHLGARGLDMPPFSFIEDEVPEQAGVRLRAVRTLPREATLPFYLEQASVQALRTLLRTLARRLNPQRGDGHLRVRTDDGTTRDLTCRYAGGLEGSRIRGESGAMWRRGALVFRAADPYWYDTQPTSITYTTGAQKSFLGDPFLPLKLTSDTVLGTQTVTNDGDVDADPVWTVHGPCTSIKLRNVTTGQVIDLPVALTAAQTVIIDTRPGRKTVRRDDGTNLFGNLTPASSLWPLPMGDSQVTAELPGATADTYVTLTYARRWLTP